MSREEVAREAARLLYNRVYKEYKEAKEIAASSLRTKMLPSNYEIAIELDKLSEEQEGPERLTRLIEMRKIALNIMRTLKKNNPTLIGSVWRGTSRNGSDIDIILYHEEHENLQRNLKDFQIVKTENKEFMINGLPLVSRHITLKVQNYDVEIVVRSPRDLEVYKNERCETYGDVKKGIKINELERLMNNNPLRRFIPKRRYK
jgi:predicted nucleotidyltransferase